MGCSGQGQGTGELVQLHPEPAVLPLSHSPNQTKLLQGLLYLLPTIIYSPPPASSGNPSTQQVRGEGKVSNKAELLCSH